MICDLPLYEPDQPSFN